MTDDWDDCESGPFCRHWADYYTCTDVCATCGHSCPSHDQSCDEPGCTCEKFVDKEHS